MNWFGMCIALAVILGVGTMFTGGMALASSFDDESLNRWTKIWFILTLIFGALTGGLA